MTLNPIRLVKHTARLLTIRNRAETVLVLAEDADQHRERYRDPNWWSRLFIATGRLWAVLPLPREIREMTLLWQYLANWKTTLGGVAVIAAGVAKVANDPSSIMDPTTIAMFGAGWAALHAKDMNVTGGTREQ